MLCAAAVGLGGCLATSSTFVEGNINNTRRFFILSLVGEVISLLAFVSYNHGRCNIILFSARTPVVWSLP